MYPPSAILTTPLAYPAGHSKELGNLSTPSADNAAPKNPPAPIRMRTPIVPVNHWIEMDCLNARAIPRAARNSHNPAKTATVQPKA